MPLLVDTVSPASVCVEKWGIGMADGTVNSPKPAAQPDRGSDEQVLALRDSGKTYAAVASSLGFERSVDAQAAFLRALRQCESEERGRLAQRESDRLDQLETRIRTRDAAEPEKLERGLLALAKLREKLGAVAS
jgi:hypothetical protein